MAWRDARDVRDISCPDSAFEYMDNNLLASEGIRLVATPNLFYDEYGAYKKWPLALAVTSKRVIVVKPRMVGPKSWEYPIQDFLRYSVGLFNGGGPSWEVRTEMQRGSLRFIFQTHDAAEFVAEYINSGGAMA